MISQVQRAVIVRQLGANDLAEDCVSQAILELLVEGKDPSFSLVLSRASARRINYLKERLRYIGESIYDVQDREPIGDYPEIPDQDIPDYLVGLSDQDSLSAVAILCASRTGSRVSPELCAEARDCKVSSWTKVYRPRLSRAVEQLQHARFHSEPLPVSEPLPAVSGNQTRVFFRHVWKSPDTVFPRERSDGNRDQARWILDSADFYADQIVRAIFEPDPPSPITSAIREAYRELAKDRPLARDEWRCTPSTSPIPLRARWFYGKKPLQWATMDNGRVLTDRDNMPVDYPLARLDRYGYWETPSSGAE